MARSQARRRRVFGSIRFGAGRARHISLQVGEVGDFLGPAIFQNLEVRGFQVGNVMPLRIGDDGIQLHQLDGHADYRIG